MKTKDKIAIFLVHHALHGTELESRKHGWAADYGRHEGYIGRVVYEKRYKAWDVDLPRGAVPWYSLPDG